MDICSMVQGRVLEVLVAVGDSVGEGDEVAIIESMKMEVPVQAPGAGTIASIMVAVGDAVADGTPLAVIA